MKKQPILGTIQKWLNKTYSGVAGFQPIAISEVPGWETTNAMLAAYQIEEGISHSVISAEISSGKYNFTEQNFVEMTPGTDFSVQSNLNKLMILQGAFYIQGINPGPFGATTYSSEFENAVSTLQTNAGIEATGVADFLVVKGLLSMNSFVVLPQDGGVEPIAEIQRALNADYAGDMGGLIPCDGIYGRELNKALIYAVQIQEGISVPDANEADGYFSPRTQQLCPTLSQGESNGFVTILQYALYCNGYTSVGCTGTYDGPTVNAVASFGRSMGISTNGGQTANLNLWMGLLLSSGNPNRAVSGCDSAQRLSYEDAQNLKANGYNIVGRYLTDGFGTSVEELTDILNAGLNVFPIYETWSNQTAYFTSGRGTSDAIAAAEACRNFGIPEGTRIYFTVDYDMEAYQIKNLVIPYFEEIYNQFNSAEIQYNIGVYGSRYVCSEVINAGYADLAFVDGASTGYSGNMGFPMPEAWAFNQIKEGVDIDGIQIDNDQVSGAESGFSCLVQGGNPTVINNILLTGPTYKEEKKDGVIVYNYLSYLLENIINLKSQDLTELFHFNKEEYMLSGGPFYFADDTCYLKYDSGFKVQLGSGSNINMYFDADEDGGNFNFDILGTSGVGSNISKLIFNSDFDTKLSSLLPTISKGNFQFYTSWQANQQAEEGYYEMGMEIGFTIPASENNNQNNNSKIESVQDLTNSYVFIDLIIGIKKDILLQEGDMASVYNLSTNFAFKLFVETASTLTNLPGNGPIIVSTQSDNSVSLTYNRAPEIWTYLIKGATNFAVGIYLLLGVLKLERRGSIG